MCGWGGGGGWDEAEGGVGGWEGEDGGAGRWEEGDCVGLVGRGHFDWTQLVGNGVDADWRVGRIGAVLVVCLRSSWRGVRRYEED